MKKFAAYVRSMLNKQAYLNVFAEEPTPEETPEGTNTPEDKKDEPNQTQAEPKPSGSVNYEDLIKKAREEEKGKLYPQIEKLKKDKNDLLLVVGERDATIESLNKKVSKLEETNGKLSTDLETGTKTNQTVSELTLTISQLEQQLEEATATYEKDMQAVKLDALKKEKIASANGEIIPELVTGNSEEEIEESFVRAKERYAEITNRAVSGVKLPYTNPTAQSTQLTAKASEQDIMAMSPSEYAEYRKEIGLK